MSVAARVSPSPREHLGLRMNAEAFFALGETDARLQLVDGVVVVSPSPKPNHQKVAQAIFRQLDRFAERTGEIEIFLDTDVRFDDGLVYCPDISVYLAGRLKRIPDRLIRVPDLIVEVLSPGSRNLDLVTKLDDYETYKVREYLIADPETGELRQWVRRGSRLVETIVVGDRLPSVAVEKLSLDRKALRAAARSR